ncbi:hypothetical protein MY5147_007425 [Beauveria neobassiana]
MNLAVSHKTWHCLGSSPSRHPVGLLERKLVSAALAALTSPISYRHFPTRLSRRQRRAFPECLYLYLEASK